MNTKPYWREIGWDRYDPLQEDLDVEVLVIGGGITGITTAWLLAREGCSVALVERDRLAARDSGHTTAHLTYMTDTRLKRLMGTFSEREVRMAWEAGGSAMTMIRTAVEALGIDCELRLVPGYLTAAEEADRNTTSDDLRKESELAANLGFEVVHEERDPVTHLPTIHFPDQMEFHPLKYLRAIAADARDHGARIHERTEVTEFGRRPRHVVAGGHTIRFRDVVVATHIPLQGRGGSLGSAMFQTKLVHHTTYAVAARIPGDAIGELIWSDTADPFRYLRISRTDSGMLAILGGEDHKTGQAEDPGERFARLGDRLSRWIPGAEITHRWSGQVVETVDGLPFIGEAAANQFIATGFSGNGYTFGTAAAMMARDWINGYVHPWTDVFDPARKSASTLGTYLRENSDYPRKLVRDRVSTPRGKPSEVGTGEGKVIKHHGEHIAVHRDEAGTVHMCDAVCPHLGCIVAWNAAEKTWDCPCHGSRFTSTGRVISGPAESDLRPVELSSRETGAAAEA